MLVAQQRSEKTFEIWGSGKPIREWCYIEDAAEAIVASVEKDGAVRANQFVQNKGHSIAEIVRMVAEILEYDGEFVFNTGYADGWPVKILHDRRFRERWPDFTFTPLHVGIGHTVEYYRQRLGTTVPSGAI